MIDKDIRERVEMVIDTFTSVELTDIAELTRLYARLKEIEYLAQASSESALERTAVALADLIRKAIARETDNPEHYLRHAEARLAALQFAARSEDSTHARMDTDGGWPTGSG